MLINLRNALMAGKQELSYVSDSMTHWLDGIWNVGYKQPHDSSTRNWKDIIGGVVFSPRYYGNNAYFVGGNRLHFTGENSDIWLNNTKLMNGTTELTIELVLDSRKFTGFCNIIYWNKDGNDSAGRIAINKQTKSEYGAISPAFNTPLTSGTIQYNNPLWTYLNTFYCAYSISASGIAEFYHNGLNTHTYVGVAGMFASISGLVNRNVIGPGFGGDVYRVSTHSRVLTADEIAHNYAIDKARFNLPDAS